MWIWPRAARTALTAVPSLRRCRFDEAARSTQRWTGWRAQPFCLFAVGGFFREGRYLGAIAIAVVFTLWLAISEQGFALVRPIMFPSPRMVFAAAMRIRDVLLMDVVATMGRVICWLPLWTAAGLGFGLVLLNQ